MIVGITICCMSLIVSSCLHFYLILPYKVVSYHFIDKFLIFSGSKSLHYICCFVQNFLTKVIFYSLTAEGYLTNLYVIVPFWSSGASGLGENLERLAACSQVFHILVFIIVVPGALAIASTTLPS